jgi:uncharacterized protein with von Willebrand factor type A (vWA) domain
MKHLLLVLALLFVGCGGANRPEDTVNGFFDSFRNADFLKMAGFLEKAGGNFDEMAKMPAEAKELVKAVYGKLETKIEAVQIQGDKAVVKVNIGMVDLKAAMNGVENEFKAVMAKVMQSGNTDRNALRTMVQKELLGLFQKAMSAPNLQRTSESGDLNLVKVNGAWKLSKSQKFGDNLFEGLENILELGN